MTSPEQIPVPDNEPRDEPSGAPAGDQAPEAPLTDADMPASPLPLDTDVTAIPDSDRAPGVVHETPVGGRLPPDSGGFSLPVPPAEGDAALRDMPAPQDLAAEQPAPETPAPPEHETSELPEVVAAEPAAEPGAGPAPETLAETVHSRAPEPEPAEPPDQPHEAPVESPGDAATIPSVARAEAPPAEPAAPPPPAPAASVARAEDWDEELSPELAAVLFGAASARAKPAEAAPARPESPAELAPAVHARPLAEAPGELAGPVMVTTPGEARSLPLVAGEFTAPPPDATIQGKMRYVRIEEPLRGDRGRHIYEIWEYFGPDYPALDSRLVKRVQIEEFAYADGSWKLTFRRDYSQGRDERTVRIASDGEYAERTDRIRRRDAMSNKTRREREQAGLRYAAQPIEEKRGFLSNLFGRGDGPQTEGPKSWRPATDAEMRDARRDGGAAFRYRLFEKP